MKRSIPTGAWIAAGLVAAAMLAPGVAYATATLTQIVGTNGTTVAQVSKARQVYVAPADPANAVTFEAGYSGTTDSGCLTLGSPPSGKALVITDLRYTVLSGGAAAGDMLFLSANTGCGAPEAAQILLTQGNGEYQFPGGLPVHATAGLSFNVKDLSGGTDNVVIYADGYTVPATALP
jgi:hypothetical protein